MHILLFGKNGQVGWELQRALAPLGRLTAVDFDSTDYCGDFSNPAAVAETVRLVKPDVIVNAAAHTAVDKAESEREFAELLNATSVTAIAKRPHNSRLDTSKFQRTFDLGLPDWTVGVEQMLTEILGK